MVEDREGLLQKARKFENAIARSSSEKENILILSHYGADGICASALVQNHILKHGGHSQIRFLGRPGKRELEKARAGNYDLLMLLDLGSGITEALSRIFGDKWLSVDHHEIEPEEMETPNLLNPFQFQYDGSKDACSSTLCYYITEKTRNVQSAFLSTVGALGDEQDRGQRRSLLSLNSTVIDEDSSTLKSIDSSVDLLFVGRETVPIHESIATTTACYIPGLTGNKDACLASLRGAGVDLKSATRWRTISDLTEDEKQKVLEAIVPHLQGTVVSVNDLVGSLYFLSSEDEFSPIRNARDFASLLNSLGRLGSPGIGISLCLGGEGEAQNAVESALLEYRTELIRTVQTLLSSEDRILEKSSYVLVVGDGIVSDRLGGACCQILSTLSRAKNKVILLRTTTPEGEVKFSARQREYSSEGYDLGSLFSSLSKSVGGIGGGLRNVAGARFSIAKQQEFQTGVDAILQNQKPTLRQS